MKTKSYRLSCRSIKDVFLYIILLIMVSTFITIYETIRYTPWVENKILKIQWKLPLRDLHKELKNNSYKDYLRKIPEKKSHIRTYKGLSHSKKPSQILTTLLKLQETIFGERRSANTAVLWLDNKDSIEEADLYSSNLKSLGLHVKMKQNYLNDKVSLSSELSPQLYYYHHHVFDNWTLFLYFKPGPVSPDTLEILQKKGLRDFQKVNHIPSLINLFLNKGHLCHDTKLIGEVENWRGKFNYKPCYCLSDTTLEDIQVPLTSENTTWWRLYEPTHLDKRLQEKTDPVKLVSHEQLKIILQSKPSSDIIFQEIPKDLLLIDGEPLFLRVYISVTSMHPLRTYLHTHIKILQLQEDDGVKYLKITNKAGKLWNLLLRIHNSYGQSSAEKLLSFLKMEIVSLLMLAETLITQSNKVKSKNILCPNCFQLIHIDLTIDSSFRPFILDIQCSPVGSGSGENLPPNSVIRDLLSMVLQESSVTIDVAYALDEQGLDIGLMEGQCNVFDQFCLSNQQLLYLLESRAESLNLGEFIRLYPSEDISVYNNLVQQLQQYLLENSIPTKDKGTERIQLQIGRKDITLHTALIHSLLIGLETFYASNTNRNPRIPDNHDVMEFDMDPNISKKSDVFLPTVASYTNRKLEEKKYQEADLKDRKYLRPSCSEDPLAVPFLMKINIEPPVKLTPAFDPNISTYETSVPYELLLIKIWGFAQSCQCISKIDDKFGFPRAINYTLGIGTNRITIAVVDVTYMEPLAVNTYTVIIHRRQPQKEEFSPGVNHVVCSLKQDCSLKFSEDSDCGLHKTAFNSWSDMLSYIEILPPCVTADMPGQWVVPCSTCSSTALCYWQKAIWQPKSCTHRWFPRNQLQKCFTNKKLLFLGDSTNRGIMHYILEKVNMTLQEWDKTHNIKHYDNLNNHTTSMSFAYYPQFWLPTDHRPTFDKAFYQLLRKNLPIENNTNTVLVIGGVHWLNKHHIDIIKRGLKREGLTGIFLVIKDLGAGFHQPVEGLHCLNLKEQQKLLSHNSILTNYARQNGFHVVETFNMTMSRYRDFLQGQCACHFHKVVTLKKQKKKCHKKCPHSQSDQEEDYQSRTFHVEGEINAIYSEMMITQICSHSFSHSLS
ncbi:cadherin-like and PC-esterase domain-containing protein 1 [Octopus sinensis]|uniref:Cadherin-like and PC-esterase domain-containing protein 1 n=1 Tax=Octopus sinensis TaxID=2607531 RepID=A0A6P7UAT8_9MOLL|nr:cadherin-like and PC-esterase domain-containing protein 1 [Octopus sinensis]